MIMLDDQTNFMEVIIEQPLCHISAVGRMKRYTQFSTRRRMHHQAFVVVIARVKSNTDELCPAAVRSCVSTWKNERFAGEDRLLVRAVEPLIGQ